MRESHRIPVPTVLTATALVLVFVVYWVTFQVRFSEAAVRIRFGQADEASVIDGRDPAQVGLHLKWPPPVEFVRKFDLRLRVLETLDTELKTRDGQNLIVSAYALWRVKDPLLYAKRVPSDERAAEQLRVRLKETQSVVLGRHAITELVNLDREVVSRSHEAIRSEMLAHAGPGVLQDYGIELVDVGLRRISLPAEATAKVQEAMIQERNRLAARFEAEGRSIADAIKARAEQVKSSLLAFAERKAKEIESAGVQASTRIFAQIDERDQEFFLWLRWLEALEVALKTKTTIFLDWSTDLFENFHRPFRPGGGAVPAGGSGGGDDR